MLREAKQQEQKLRGRIAASLAENRPKRARYFTQLYLQSPSAKLVAATLANRKLKKHRRVKEDLLPEVALSVDPWKGTDEPVALNARPKRSNPQDFRLIFNFGIRNRTLQILARRALQPWAKLHPGQFAIQGGRHAACKAVLEALEDGYRWAVQTDITDCFTTFDEREVAKILPLPEKVTDRVLTSRHLSIQSGNVIDWVGPAGLPVEARQGIPQGSATSSLVTEILLASVAFSLPMEVATVFYADDILLMMRDKAEAVAMKEALSVALRAHPAGPLWPKFIEVQNTDEGFDFLGYRLETRYGSPGIQPTGCNLHKFKHRYHASLCKLKHEADPHARKTIVRHLRRYVRSWTAAFALWEQRDAVRADKLAEIKHMAESVL